VTIPLKLVIKQRISPEGHDGGITCLINHTDGQIVSASSESIRVWEQDSLGNYKCKQVLTINGMLASLLSLPHGRLAFSSWGRGIRIWDGGECTHTVQQEDLTTALLLLPNGLMVCGVKDHLILLNPENGFQLIDKKHSKEGYSNQLLLLKNGKSFASAWSCFSIMIWEFHKELKCIKTVKDFNRVFCITNLPDGNILVGGRMSIKVYDNDLICLKVIEKAHLRNVTSMVLISGGLLVSASAETIKIWDIYSDFNCLRTIKEAHAFHNRIDTLIQLPNGFASCSPDKTTKIWDII
jgi:WD40 repeat protein